MAEELVGNVLVGQSGGPTAVINASVEGVSAEALNHASIEEIYGALNGVLGILNEDFIDLAAESQQTIRWFTARQLRGMLARAGFEPVHAIADFEPELPVEEDAQIITVVARKG